ncbi:unnamed protein product [Ilex paraguariensis]|uniref:Peptidase S59 domain-containing protein n=1 Tax=Ilex paraguariensis TaxID=185542 RepID=A0ABC8T8F0_9AQUA
MAKIDQLDALYACVGLVGSDFGLLRHRFCRVLTITSQLKGGCEENLWIQHLLSKTLVFNTNVLVVQQSLFAAMMVQLKMALSKKDFILLIQSQNLLDNMMTILSGKWIRTLLLLTTVLDFVVGRHGCGSIKFIGETDVRRLDLESLIQFNNWEVIVYVDGNKKPPVGQGLNKPAEVMLLNIKCLIKRMDITIQRD